jgi:hypothetical protein
VEESQHHDVDAGKFIPQKVTPDPKIPNFSRIKFAEPRATARKIQQRFRSPGQPVENGVGRIEIMLGKKRV